MTNSSSYITGELLLALTLMFSEIIYFINVWLVLKQNQY